MFKNKKLMYNINFFKGLLIVFIGLLIFYNIFLLLFSEKKYTNRFTNNNFHIEYNSDSSSEFYIYEDNIYYLSKDGIKLYDKNGKVIWEDIFSVNYPIFLKNNNFIFVMEDKGGKVFLYSEKGLVYNTEFDCKILSSSLNKNGYTSIILKETEKDYIIKAFSNEGLEIANVPQTNDEIYPVSSDISEDNRILVFSTLDISGINIESHLMFFYLNPIESSEKTNVKLISGSDEENQMISIVKFMEGNNLITVSDNEIVGRKEEEKLNFEEVFRKKLNNRIKKIDFINGKNIVYILGDEFLNTQGEESGSLKIINTNGKTLSEFPTNMKVDYMYNGFEYIIVGEESKFVAYDRSGNKLWQYDSIINANQLLFYKNTRTILEISLFEGNMLKYKRVKNY